MPAGRPTDYREEYAEQARKLCLLGATNEGLAKAFDVVVSTIDLWIATHPEFSGAVKAGREMADADVAASLYHRAKGYSHPAVKIFLHEGKPVTVEYEEHYPPDTAAAFIWLKNRRRQNWKNQVPDGDDGDGNTLKIVNSPDAD